MIKDQKDFNPFTAIQAPLSEAPAQTCGPIFNDNGDELFTAGQFAPEGTYLELDSGRCVTLDRMGPLPASLNGRRAYYSRLERPWLMSDPSHSIRSN